MFEKKFREDARATYQFRIHKVCPDPSNAVQNTKQTNKRLSPFMDLDQGKDLELLGLSVHGSVRPRVGFHTEGIPS